MLEIWLVIAVGLLFLKHFIKYMRSKKKKEQAKRQADLVSTIQGSIPLNPLPMNPAYASAPAAPMMIEDKTFGNTKDQDHQYSRYMLSLIHISEPTRRS